MVLIFAVAVEQLVMIDDIEAAGLILEQLSSLTHQYTAPADGCATYQYVFKSMKALEEGLHEHIFLENSVLFDMK